MASRTSIGKGKEIKPTRSKHKTEIKLRVNTKRVYPFLTYDLNTAAWDSEKSTVNCTYFFTEYNRIGFNDKNDYKRLRDDLKSKLTERIKFNKSFRYIPSKYHSDIIFLCMVIQSVINGTDIVVSEAYEELGYNYLKIKAYMRLHELDNLGEMVQSNFTLSITSNLVADDPAIFKNLTLHDGFGLFLSGVARQVDNLVPGHIKKILNGSNRSALIALIKNCNDKSVKITHEYKTDKLKANVTIALRNYLRTIPPFQLNNNLCLTFDEIRLIYKLYTAMGLEVAADKNEKYIRRFLKSVEDHRTKDNHGAD